MLGSACYPLAIALLLGAFAVNADPISAGAAKIDITNAEAGPVNDPLFVKALVLKNNSCTLAIITIDVVALAEIGALGNDFLPKLRAQIQTELNIPPASLLVNASHCHGVVCSDVQQRTVQAVKEALQQLAPVNIGAGVGFENRISENRRFKLNNGDVADVRHAYALPPDDEIAEIGPIDPEIGILRIDRKDGRPLAVVYNFACHPILGVPSRANTADLSGFASSVIEDNAGDGTVALFLQGCAGDINPVLYKDVNNPRDAEPLGTKLGLSVLKALKTIRPVENVPLRVVNDTIALPRADLSPRIAALENQQNTLLHSLQGTSLNLKTFLPLAIKYNLSPNYPADYAPRYLHEKALGQIGLEQLDTENRKNIDQYIQNILTMEQLTRVNTNLDLLRKHQAENIAALKNTVDAEIQGIRIGEFTLIAFPGELSVQIGLNIKAASPFDLTFVSGCSNGYLYYAPTREQLANSGCAQEDSDCILAPDWQALFEEKTAQLLKQLQ